MRTYTRRNTIREFKEPIEGALGLCRLCLEKVEATESIPIFANKSDVCTSLATRIMMCVGYEITHEDCLPNTICTGCHKELNNYYEFRKKCIATYHKLKSHVFSVRAKKANDVEQVQKLIPNLSVDNDRSSVPSVDRCILTLNEMARKEHVNTECSGLQNNIVIRDLNGLTNGTNIKGVQSSMQETDRTKSMVEVCPDVAEFLSSVLIEMGMLKKQEDEVLLTENCRTIQIETSDGVEITFEIFEIEEEQINTTISKTGNVKKKIRNELPKVLANERPRCGECGRRFATRGALRRHRRTHTGERPHRCAHCDRAFAQRAVLLRHELVHQEVRPFACARCPKSFTQRGALAAHARRHAAPDARALALHRCTKCPKVFLHASGLSRHALAHSGRVYACAECERRFSDNSSLRRHARAKHAAPLAHIPPK